ncbi:hypothetical protein GCM10027051_03780 [Niabella terrae]
MNWKAYSAVCGLISVALTSVPQNIIGCGGSLDPYDYYVGFFNQYAASQLQYKPFFYTNELFLYDREEPKNPQEVLIGEWKDFTGNQASAKDVNTLVMKWPARDISTLYYHIEKGRPARLPDSVGNNSMARFFLKNRNLEALGYLLYAKKVEPHVTSTDTWEPETRDSLMMDKLLKNGLQLYRAAKTDLFRMKYAYQIIRLAHYNHHYREAAQYYEDLAAGNPTQTVLQPLSLALKAGALFRLGQNKQAAYLFSQAFMAGDVKKVSNFYGFNWSVVRNEDRQPYLAFCKNAQEKTAMLSLFALQNPEPDLQAIQEIYTLDPSAELLSTLVIREINKYEERYLTPLIGRAYNTGLLGIEYYYQFNNEQETDSLLRNRKPGLVSLVNFLNDAAKSQKVKDPALMRVAGAYGAYMLRDFSKARDYLAQARSMKLSSRLEDQWMLTNLLVQISAQEKIDAAFEKDILPSLEWLYKKASPPVASGTRQDLDWNGETLQWRKFYRNLAVEILSKRYRAQGDLQKALLAMGSAETIEPYYYTALDYMRDLFSGKQTEVLYQFLNAKKFTPYEAFLARHIKLTISEVADFAGTAYLRDYNYDKAISWLQKSDGSKEIGKDPFIELMYDREEELPGNRVTTTKLAYAREMKRLQALTQADPAQRAATYYKLALGYYNVTYYGYAWNLVEYFRSGVDGYHIPANATGFQKEYYGAFTAQEYFKKALDASKDPEFQAKCLFMMARCSQKQITKPRYLDFGYDQYDLFKQKEKEYYKEFASNKYFPQMQTRFGDTRFFQEAKSRCSYLADFLSN